MKWFDILKLSFSNLWRRKLRSILTLLGVIIGTASIVTMLSIGIAQTEAMIKMISSSSDLTTITVRGNDNGVYNAYDMVSSAGPGTGENQENLKLTRETIEMFRSIPNVRDVSPVLAIDLHLSQGGYENYITLQGMTPEAIASKNIYITDGEMPDFSDSADPLPLLIGQDVLNSFWNPNSQNYEPAEIDLLNQTAFATIQDYSGYDTESAPPKKFIISASAVMGSPDPMSWSENLYSAYTDLNHLENFLAQNYRGKAWPGQPASKTGKPVGDVIYSSAYVFSSDLKYTKDILTTLRDMGFWVDSNVEFIDSMREQSASQQLVLGGIGGVSLLVAAIGIANTMMMSVYERTKEIGIFKVLGCSLSSIRNIFLTEAALLGLIGGILGIGLSFVASAVLNMISANSLASMGIYIGSETAALSIIPLWLILGAILFAMLIGIIAGVLPARRAMKLSALEAIRNN